ncbi:MAG: hypothetical protein U0Q12_02040 [Vicinamibacterales bacterium]
MARSSPFVGAALALIAGGHLVAQSANISITIVTPVEGAMSASPLVVTYSVMSIFQVASVTGVVGSRTMNGAGQVDLTGLAEGPQTLVLTATDVFGACIASGIPGSTCGTFTRSRGGSTG